jgi:transposase-like protein
MKMKHRERITQYSEAFKRKVVEEIERGELNSREAARTYGISSGSTISNWLRKYGSRKYETKIVRVMMKSERDEINELKKALADERIRSLVFSRQLESYEKYVPDLKKRLDTKQLKEFEEREQKIKQYR